MPSSRPLRATSPVVLVVLTLAVVATMVGSPAATDANVADDAPSATNLPTMQEAGPMRPDPDIVRMVRAVSAENMRRLVDELSAFGTRHTLSSQTDPDRGIGAAVDYVYDEFQAIAQTAGGRMTVEKQTFLQQPMSRIPVPTYITNVVATLHGTDPASANRMYVIGGHLDSRCSNVMDAECDAPGANDDASGVAGAIEAARVLAPRAHGATLVFVAFNGEEQGLLGAAHFAQQAVANGYDIQGVLNNDMIGNTVGGSGITDDRTIRIFSEGVPSNESTQDANRRRSNGGEMDGHSRQLSRYIAEVGAAYTPDLRVWQIARRDRFGRGGDQTPFLERGFPAVRFTEPHENFEQQHQNIRVVDGVQYGDLPEFVDERYMARVNRLNVATLASLARSPGTPRNVRIITSGSGISAYDTTLRWNANPDAAVHGYEIVWRDTMDQEWTFARRVGNVTQATLTDISKDNYMFGVRAIDRAGQRSPVAYAR